MNLISRKRKSRLTDLKVQLFKARLQNDPGARTALTSLRKGIVNRACVPLLVERAEKKGGWVGGRPTDDVLAQLDFLPAEKWARRGFLIWAIAQLVPGCIAFLCWLLTPNLGVLETIKEYWSLPLTYICLSLGSSLAVNWLCRVESEDRVIRRILRMGGFLDFFEDPTRYGRTLWAWRPKFLRFWLAMAIVLGGVGANIYNVDRLQLHWFFVLDFTWITALISAVSHHWEIEVETAAFMGLDNTSSAKRHPFGDAHAAGDDDLRKAGLL